jgi:hypothetical protein
MKAGHQLTNAYRLWPETGGEEREEQVAMSTLARARPKFPSRGTNIPVTRQTSLGNDYRRHVKSSTWNGMTRADTTGS